MRTRIDLVLRHPVPPTARIAIIVATYDAIPLRLLWDCLPTWRNGRSDTYLMLWDNDTPITQRAEHCRLWGEGKINLLIRSSENIGCHTAWNQLLIEAMRPGMPFEYAFLVNADVELLPGALDAMVEAIASREEIGIVGWPQAIRGPRTVDSEGFVDQIAHECILTRIDLWRETGLYNEALPYYSADSHKSIIAEMHGWRTYIVRDHGEGYRHRKSEQVGTPEVDRVRKLQKRDSARWGEIERGMHEYWARRLGVGEHVG